MIPHGTLWKHCGTPRKEGARCCKALVGYLLLIRRLMALFLSDLRFLNTNLFAMSESGPNYGVTTHQISEYEWKVDQPGFPSLNLRAIGSDSKQDPAKRCKEPDLRSMIWNLSGSYLIQHQLRAWANISMDDFKYYDIPSPFPTLAHRVFTMLVHTSGFRKTAFVLISVCRSGCLDR